MKPWAEVEASPEFAALSAQEQNAAREQYFAQVVAPKVPREELGEARAQFDHATRIRKQDLPDGVQPSTAGGGRGAVNPPVVQPVARRTRGGLASEVKPFGAGDARIAPPKPNPFPSVLDAQDTGPAAMPTTPLENAAGMSIRPGAEDAVKQQLRARGQAVPGERQGVPEAKPLSVADNLAADVRDATKNPVARGAVAGFFDLGQVGAGAVRLAADLTGATDLAQFAGGASRVGKAMSDGSLRGLHGNDKLVAQVTNSILVSTPAMAMGVAGGPALRTLFAQSALAEYNEGRNAGFDVAQSAARAGIMGAAEALGERFGFAEQVKILKGVVRGMPSNEMAKTLGAMLTKEVPGEQLTTAMQFLADKAGPAALNPRATFGDYLEQAGETLKVTIGQSMVMGGGPAAVSTTRDAMRDADRAIDTSAKTVPERAAAAAGFSGAKQDPEQAKQLAIEASPYGRARAKGFVVEPPLATDPPEAQRTKVEGVFRNAAAAFGIGKKATDAVLAEAEKKPLADLPGFLARATQALKRRGLVAAELDDDVLQAIGAGPVVPAAPVEATQAPAAAVESTTTAADAGPTEDFTGLADPSAPPVMTTAVDAAAHQAAHSPTNDRPEPTPAQKEAGNYAKGHTRIGSLSIAIENPQGSIRRGTSPDGKAWESPMAAHYGYIKGTHAGDGDHSDVFIRAGTPPEYSGSVFVIDQVDPATGKFDEHKSVIGVNTADEARALYEANYQPGWKGFGAVTELPMEAFKSWVRDGVKRKPLGSLAAPDQSAPQGVGAEPAPSSQTSSTTNQGGANDLTNNGVRGEAAIGAASPAKPRKAPRGGSGPLDAISRAGGISPDIIADLSRKTARTRTSKTGKQTQYTAWHNPMAGGKGPVFRAGGTADLNELARILQENGFLEPGLVERDYLEANSRVQDILKAALNGEKVLREGDADAVEREMRARQEAAMDAQPDPFDFLSADDLASEGYTAATPRVRDLTERLLEDAEAAGLDTEAMREDAARQTEGLTEDEYHAALQQAIDQALAQHGEGAQARDVAGTGAGDSDRVQATGPPGPAGSERADRPDGAVRPEEGLSLEAQTAADLAAKTEREAAAVEADRRRQQELEDRARADAMRDEFTLTGSDRPADVAAAAGQRDIFSEPEPAAPPAVRAAVLSDEQAFAGDFARFAGKPVTQEVLVTSTGQTARLTIPDAAQALRELAVRRRALQELRTCLGRRA